MENKKLDQIIKDKLNQLDEHSSSDWSLMESLLQMDGLLDKDIQDFDETMRFSLEKEQPIDTHSWVEMAATLDLMDDLEDIPSSEVQNFDEILKSKLHAINPMSSDWDAFSEQLEAQPEKIMDEIAKEKLTTLDNTGKSDWEVLAPKLAEELSFKRRIIYRYKILESAVLILFLITFINFYPDYKDQIKSLLPDSGTFFSFNHKREETIVKKNIEHKTATSPLNSTKKSSQENIPLINHYEGFVDGAVKVKETTLPNPIKITSANYKNISDISIQSNDLISTVKTQVLSEREVKSKSNFFSRIFSKKEKETQTQNLKITSPKHLENISLTALDYEKNKKLPSFFDKLKKIPFGITAGMMMVGNYNLISTPEDKVLGIDAYKSTGLGYGAGFTMGFEFDKIEIHKGIIYKGNTYKPLGREIVGNSKLGVYSLRLNEININTLEIPMHIRYHFYDKNDWNLYAGAGATMGLVFQANYFLTTDEVRQPTSQNLGARTSAVIENSNLHQDKIYRNGAFEGGSFIENQLYTADLSFGAELKLSKRWGIFMEHTFQYALPSNYKGPNNDKINHYNIYLGVRSRLR